MYVVHVRPSGCEHWPRLAKVVCARLVAPCSVLCACAQLLVARLRWEDPPDKSKLFPDTYAGALAPWSEEGRKKLAKAETKQWSATMGNPVEVESVAKVF